LKETIVLFKLRVNSKQVNSNLSRERFKAVVTRKPQIGGLSLLQLFPFEVGQLGVITRTEDGSAAVGRMRVGPVDDVTSFGRDERGAKVASDPPFGHSFVLQKKITFY
jgi:hypothetical protein